MWKTYANLSTQKFIKIARFYKGFKKLSTFSTALIIINIIKIIYNIYIKN